MSQTNVREGYGITTLEVVELIEDLISYLLKSLRSLTLKDWLAVAKCTRLRNAQIPKVFHEAAAGTIWTIMLAKVRQYGAKVKTENLSNMLMLTLSETAQRQSLSVVSNRSTASITDKFGVASLTEPAILNNANVALVDAVHHSVVIDALTMTLIKDDDDLLGTVNSHIKSRRLGAVMLLLTFQPDEPLEQPSPPKKRADSRHAKASGGRTKKDKDLEDSDTGSDVPRLRRRDRAAARARSAERKRLLDSDDYRLDSSSDIDSEDDSEDEEATTAKDLLTDAYILYFKELLSDNGRIFANAIGIGKTRAIVLAVLIGHVHFKNWTEVQNARAEGDAIEHNAVDDDDKLYPTEGKRTFYCACERSPSFNAEPRQAATMMTGWGRAANAWKNEVVAMDLANSMWCDLSDPLALRFCFFSDSPPENIGRPTKEEAMEMRIDTTDAISKALAAANKLVALQSYVLGGVDHRETVYWTIPEANTPAVHSKATKHCLAPSAARFVIVCGFGKVDKHVFRAYNTMSVTAQRTIIRKGGPYVEKRAILLPAWALSGTPMEQGLNEILIFVSLALIGLQNRKGRFMLKRTLKTRDLWGKPISGIKGDFLPYFQSCLCPDFLSTVQNAEQQCRDILEKEGLDESEASRRVIFNCFEMQAIASYPALATLKAAQFKIYSSCKVKRFTLNSVKDLFTNLSKDYFLVREARAITKSSLKFQNLSNLCSERDLDGPWIIVALMAFAEAITLTEATHVVIMEPQDRQNTQDQFIF
ncbi:hypothetical protein HBI59_091030 [Parastagonospora nodorum]|nr:hypothetical protein HBI59_091030 [Parastagonospora nodorum]